MMTLHSLKLFLLKSGVPNGIIIAACAVVIVAAYVVLRIMDKRH